MHALSRVRIATCGLRHRATRIASLAAMVVAITSPLPAAADGWEVRLVNDGEFTTTFTVTWTYNNFSYAASDVKVYAPGDLNVYKPAVGPVETDHGTVVTLPNDYHVHTEGKRHDGKTVTTDFSAAAPHAGTPDDIRKALDKFPGRSEFRLPIPTGPDGPEIFTGVNLADYLADPLDSIPTSVSFVDGISPELPGYVVGLSALTIDPVTGNYVTSDPFTGDVTFDAESVLVAVPEPQAWLLFAVGLTALGGWSRRRSGPERRSDS